MREYDQIGQETLKDFYKSWEQQFQKFGDDSLDKIQQLQHEHEEQMQLLN